jgi:uncharacterized protein YecT (DUF1311 family)
MKHLCSLAFTTILLAVALPVNAQLKAPAPPPPAAGPAMGSAPQGPAGAGGPPQVDPLTREFRECIQKAQAAMQAAKADDPGAIHACLTAEIKRQDGRLANAAQKLAKIVPPDSRKKLETANADWRRYRGSECGFMAEENGPPPANLQNADCRLRMTTLRAADLDNLASMLARQEAAFKAQQENPPPATPATPAVAPPAPAK